MNAAGVDFEDSFITSYKGVTIYVDKLNERLKIMDCKGISQEIANDLINLSVQYKLGKIICNTAMRELKAFKNAGFAVEGIINGYFKGEDACCVSYFIDKKREVSINKSEEDKILNECFNARIKSSHTEYFKYEVRDAAIEDIPQMIKLFSGVFKTYPSPVYSAEYLRNTMGSKNFFKVAIDKGEIISMASADMDKKNMNAEITDCATYPEYRGKGILTVILHSLEKDLKTKGFYSLYSLSRAINPAINLALKRLSYNYSGRLLNNCNICGGFEDMNIWVKKLQK